MAFCSDSIVGSETQITKARLILVYEDRGRFRLQGATLGLDGGIAREETRHRDLYALEVSLGVVKRGPLQACLVHSHLDAVDASKEQFGWKVRGDLHVWPRRCPERRLQPPREQALDREREHQEEEKHYHYQDDHQPPPPAPGGAEPLKFLLLTSRVGGGSGGTGLFASGVGTLAVR